MGEKYRTPLLFNITKKSLAYALQRCVIAFVSRRKEKKESETRSLS